MIVAYRRSTLTPGCTRHTKKKRSRFSASVFPYFTFCFSLFSSLLMLDKWGSCAWCSSRVQHFDVRQQRRRLRSNVYTACQIQFKSRFYWPTLLCTNSVANLYNTTMYERECRWQWKSDCVISFVDGLKFEFGAHENSQWQKKTQCIIRIVCKTEWRQKRAWME